MQRPGVDCASKVLSGGYTDTDQIEAILSEIMPHRRMVTNDVTCFAIDCPICSAPHLRKIEEAVLSQEAVEFVLPAFPGKSPNRGKVLGPLPDMAEQRALLFLDGLCRRIRRVYSPGARVILCSDGRVFSDVVGMAEDDVTAYQLELSQMIEEFGLENLSTFNLDELAHGEDFDRVRIELMNDYGQSLETLRAKVARGGQGSVNRDDIEAHRMYCGITRFLFEDALHPEQTKSRTAVQKDARKRAYEVIRRSNAWSELIAERFPAAVRLSIHPQACGSRKLGIKLVGDNSWMTPWHGVAVDTGTDFVLMKRSEAEDLGAVLVNDHAGRASHYRLSIANQRLKNRNAL